MECVALVARLKERSEPRAAELIAAGSPCDLAETGIVHHGARFGEFRCRDSAELAAQGGKLRELRLRARAGTLTLVYAARGAEHDDAVVLAAILRRGTRPGSVAKGS